MQDIKTLINLLVDKGDKDNNIEFYIGRVLTNEDVNGKYKSFMPEGRTTFFDEDNLCVAVEMQIDKSANSNNCQFYSKDSNGSYTMTDTFNDNISKDTPTIYPFVRLMVGVANGPYNIPAQNSLVRVAISTWDDPFIIQYSDIIIYTKASMSDDKLNSTYDGTNSDTFFKYATVNDATGAAISGSVNEFTATNSTTWVAEHIALTRGALQTQINSSVSGNFTQLKQKKEGFYIGKNDSVNGFYDMYTLMLGMKDQIHNLNEIVKSLTTTLNTVGSFVAPPGTAGGPCTVGPSAITDFANDIVNLNLIENDLNTGTNSVDAFIKELFLTNP